MKAIYAPFLLCLMLMLGACSSFYVAPPENYEDSAAIAATTVKTANLALREAVKAGQIKPMKGIELALKLKDVNRDIRTANQLVLTNPFEAEQKLETAIAVLELIQAELRARQ